MMFHYLTLIYRDCQRRFAFEGERTLLCVLRDNGIDITLPCGGDGRCGGCAVRISGDMLPPDEQELSRLEGRASGLRLACRVTMTGDCILHADCSSERSNDIFTGTLSVDTAMHAAFDLGTTTVALRITDGGGAVLYEHSEHNRQRSFGADVMTRIAHCDGEGLPSMHDTVCRQLRDMLVRSAAAVGQAPQRVTVAGNTAMLSILAGVDPSPLGIAPYRPTDRFGRTVDCLWRDCDGSEHCDLYFLLPCIGGFTGGDLAACLYALERDFPELAADGTLLCDLGTNGELALRCGERWLVTSAAAGPALEGGMISCGSGAVEGALVRLFDSSDSSVAPDNDSEKTAVSDSDLCTVSLGCDISGLLLGSGAPRSLSGCALLDLTALLLRRGILDRSGRLECECFELCDGISYTQQDVRQLQLAKGAVAAAALRLVEHAFGDSPPPITAVITGGLGYRIDPLTVTEISLLPLCTPQSIRALPALALRGAALCRDHAAAQQVCDLVRRCDVLELGGDSRFDELFVELLEF